MMLPDDLTAHPAWAETAECLSIPRAELPVRHGHHADGYSRD
jgi:hypothetical protein